MANIESTDSIQGLLTALNGKWEQRGPPILQEGLMGTEPTDSLLVTLHCGQTPDEDRNSGQEPGGRNREGNAAYQLALRLICLFTLSWFSYTAQAALPRNGAPHGGLGSPAPIITQDKLSQAWLQANLI